ncbi:hypothetical protein NDU88_005804 [Pleurodeles waltl]|uniref:Uncharacterized protein n=1 Tax=Pleurodeles waltl TaxID=8319 RepID=A0AAV7QIX6_PLEWA|nr:hypothetical protein NDU88_005804 [Pleurodeles waltl]
MERNSKFSARRNGCQLFEEDAEQPKKTEERVEAPGETQKPAMYLQGRGFIRAPGGACEENKTRYWDAPGLATLLQKRGWKNTKMPPSPLWSRCSPYGYDPLVPGIQGTPPSLPTPIAAFLLPSPADVAGKEEVIARKEGDTEVNTEEEEQDREKQSRETNRSRDSREPETSLTEENSTEKEGRAKEEQADTERSGRRGEACRIPGRTWLN